MEKLVIVGCGKLAGIVADAILNGLLPDYELVGVCSRTLAKAESLADKCVNMDFHVLHVTHWKACWR